MEARLSRVALVAAVLAVSLGASHRSENFVVEAPHARLAQRIAASAEQWRRDLAISWLGKAIPNWSAPCVMTVRVGNDLGAGGATTFMFEGGEVFGWRMSIQGSEERILDSVLPHEITHMILATRFRCPLPRWADEGAATSVEHAGERDKHFRMLHEFLTTGRGIAFNQMFAMREYPRDVMPLYAQGFSLAEYLIQRGGRRQFVAYLADGLKSGQWSAATERHYGMRDLGTLQNTWLAWIREGHPTLTVSPAAPEAMAGPVMLATAQRRPRPEPNLIYREPRQTVARPPLVPVVFDEPATNGTLAATESRGPLGPTSAGRAVGSGSPSKTAGARPAPWTTQPQLARPQPAEPLRQVILEWRR